jgi:cation diffusion facilitator family transporter
MILKDRAKKLKEGERAAGISILVSLLLSLAKAIVGYMSGSIVLVTDAVHSGADSITSFASWFGLKIAQKKPTEHFQYGYYKAENFATLVVSGFIFYAAIGLMLEGYSKLFVLPTLSRPYEALAVALVSSVVSYFLSRYMKRVGEKVGSQSLIANAQERRVDILSSMIVFVAILLSFYRIPYVEAVVTILISLLALKVGFDVAKDSVFALMDVSPSSDIEGKITDVLKSNRGIESFENLRLRKAGPMIFGEVKIKIRKNVNVKRAHEIAEGIESKIKDEVEDLESLSIHVEPYKTEREKITIPIKTKKGMSSIVMEHFGRANHFIFVTLNKKTNQIESDYIKENPYKKEAARAGFKTSNFIVKERIDALVTHEIGGISFNTLKNNLVDVYKVEGETVNKVVENYVKDKLEVLKGPTKELGEISKTKSETKVEHETRVKAEKAEDKIEKRRRGRRGRFGRRGLRWRR